MVLHYQSSFFPFFCFLSFCHVSERMRIKLLSAVTAVAVHKNKTGISITKSAAVLLQRYF